MPDVSKLSLILGSQPQDISKVRLPGLDKSFDKLTIGELVQLRPGSEVADSYGLEAVTDNATITTSSVLAELGRIQSARAMEQVVHQTRLNAIRTAVMPSAIAGIGARSAEGPQANEVAMPTEEEDIFKATNKDPFQPL